MEKKCNKCGISESDYINKVNGRAGCPDTHNFNPLPEDKKCRKCLHRPCDCPVPNGMQYCPDDCFEGDERKQWCNKHEPVQEPWEEEFNEALTDYNNGVGGEGLQTPYGKFKSSIKALLQSEREKYQKQVLTGISKLPTYYGATSQLKISLVEAIDVVGGISLTDERMKWGAKQFAKDFTGVIKKLSEE